MITHFLNHNEDSLIACLISTTPLFNFLFFYWMSVLPYKSINSVRNRFKFSCKQSSKMHILACQKLNRKSTIWSNKVKKCTFYHTQCYNDIESVLSTCLFCIMCALPVCLRCQQVISLSAYLAFYADHLHCLPALAFCFRHF